MSCIIAINALVMALFESGGGGGGGGVQWIDTMHYNLNDYKDALLI